MPVEMTFPMGLDFIGKKSINLKLHESLFIRQEHKDHWDELRKSENQVEQAWENLDRNKVAARNRSASQSRTMNYSV